MIGLAPLDKLLYPTRLAHVFAEKDTIGIVAENQVGQTIPIPVREYYLSLPAIAFPIGIVEDVFAHNTEYFPVHGRQRCSGLKHRPFFRAHVFTKIHKPHIVAY